MGRYQFVGGKDEERGVNDITIQDAASDFQYLVEDNRILNKPWVLTWEPTSREPGDKIVITSHQSRSEREKMVEIAFALAYPRRASGYNEWVFYSLTDIERDEFGFITNATVLRMHP